MDAELAASVSQFRDRTASEVADFEHARPTHRPIQKTHTKNMASGHQADGEERKRGVRRTALWLSLLAFAFYGGFIVLSVIRAH